MAYNVKVGDVAKFREGSLAECVGALALVLEPWMPSNTHDEVKVAHMFQHYGRDQVWKVELLQSVFVRGRYSYVSQGHHKPGTMFLTLDRFLKRIDPPADAMDLLREEPLPGEKALFDNAQLNKELQNRMAEVWKELMK